MWVKWPDRVCVKGIIHPPKWKFSHILLALMSIPNPLRGTQKMRILTLYILHTHICKLDGDDYDLYGKDHLKILLFNVVNMTTHRFRTTVPLKVIRGVNQWCATRYESIRKILPSSLAVSCSLTVLFAFLLSLHIFVSLTYTLSMPEAWILHQD